MVDSRDWGRGNGELFLMGKNFSFTKQKKKKNSSFVAQQCECTEHQTIHLKMVKWLNFMLCEFHHN